MDFPRLKNRMTARPLAVRLTTARKPGPNPRRTGIHPISLRHVTAALAGDHRRI
ncbi:MULTISPECIES: hypothetical protein [unclassified Rhizobium]|uniref:hypothetical protein n=1 Tax=unclassified Rhizobium TaxID=2613769 RepID=UPI000B03CC49|nr:MULTISPECIES: hypothetical protein [unclassified Rhizobium]